MFVLNALALLFGAGVICVAFVLCWLLLLFGLFDVLSCDCC